MTYPPTPGVGRGLAAKGPDRKTTQWSTDTSHHAHPRSVFNDWLASLYGYSNTTPTLRLLLGGCRPVAGPPLRIAYGTHCAHRFGPTRRWWGSMLLRWL